MPSRTAIAVAAARAIGARNPDKGSANPDTWAERLLLATDVAKVRGISEHTTYPMSWPEVVDYFRARSGKEFADHPGVLPFSGINLRTRYFDEVVKRSLQSGVEQVVILGAGLDSRAYRLTDAWQRGRVFEVDLPSTQTYKKQRVAAAIGEPPSNLTYIPIDFTRETLRNTLPKHGYSAEARTLFLWEGVTMYLPEAAIQETLDFVGRHSGPGSSILFDYQDATTIGSDCDDEVWKAWAQLSAEWGEPWLFGVPHSGNGNVFQLTASNGLQVVSDFTIGELCVSHLPAWVQPATFGLDRWAWRVCHASQRPR